MPHLCQNLLKIVFFCPAQAKVCIIAPVEMNFSMWAYALHLRQQTKFWPSLVTSMGIGALIIKNAFLAVFLSDISLNLERNTTSYLHTPTFTSPAALIFHPSPFPSVSSSSLPLSIIIPCYPLSFYFYSSPSFSSLILLFPLFPLFPPLSFVFCCPPLPCPPL